MNALLFRILALLPGGVLPVLALSALPVGLLSWSALRLFAGVEPLPPDPTIRA
jgi:hypothetical protein